MKVKCINSDDKIIKIHLTVGKVYDVVSQCRSHYYVVDDRGIEFGYIKRRFEKVKKMEKQIVCIDLGSEIIFNRLKGARIVCEIDLAAKVVRYSLSGNNDYNGYNYFEEFYNRDIFKSINGIPVSEIEDVRIAGYNDKVTLKIGDEIVKDDDKFRHGIGKNLPHNFVVFFDNGKVFGRDLKDDEIYEAWEFDCCEYWYVNGKKYHRDNIIIPDQSVDANEMIDQVQDSEMVATSDTDNINHPSHYAQDEIECINVIMQQCNHLNGVEGFLYGNVQKYIWRFKHKNGVEDLKKSKVYLEWLINLIEKGRIK